LPAAVRAGGVVVRSHGVATAVLSAARLHFRPIDSTWPAE